MAVTNFIPQIWEARLLAKFHERSITDLITTAPTKVEGNKVIFNKVSDVAINKYTGTVNFEDLTTSKVELTLDNKNYWAFKVDDVDAVQASGDLIDPHVQEAGYGLQEASDKFVLDEKGLPIELCQFINSSTADEIMDNVNTFYKCFNEAVEQVVTERLRGKSPSVSTVSRNTYSMDQLKGMSIEEINKNWESIKNNLK